MKKHYKIFFAFIIVSLSVLVFFFARMYLGGGLSETQGVVANKNIFSSAPTSAQEGCVVHPHTELSRLDDEYALDLRGGATCLFFISHELTPFLFVLHPDIELNTVARIDVVHGGTVMQTLDASMMQQSVYRDTIFFDTVDANFDLYSDLRLVSWSGATGNVGYTFWLYDSKKNIFVYNEILSSLTSPRFMSAEKKIYSHANGGMAGCIYGDATYAYDESNKLFMLESRIQDYDNEKNIFVEAVTTYENGEEVSTTYRERVCGE